MPGWKQLVRKPSGALPPKIGNRIVAILAVVLLIVIVATTIGGGDDETPDPTAVATEQGTLDADVEDRLASEVEEQQRQAAFAAGQERLAAQRRTIRENNLQLLDPEPTPVPEIDPLTGELIAPEEAELRLTLHLESVERKERSLRADPVALSVRDSPQSFFDAGLDTKASPQERLADRLDSLYANLTADSPAQPAAAVTGGLPATPPAGGTLDVPLPDSINRPSYEQPDRVIAPDDPAGSHRIHEGSLVEAVLVTQLSGDFPSPVIAQVAVPFYSGDRQRVLIPRGSRFVGTAQAVRDRDQARLAVGFHRLLFPDGRWAALHFQGLNQLGEGALKDQVDRHYLSTFLAAGGVGLLSGLAHAGANPYGGGQQQVFQIGAAQSFAETGTQIMDRFLNRLPTVTIRAGHRMRVWFTADLLIPPPNQGDTP